MGASNAKEVEVEVEETSASRNGKRRLKSGMFLREQESLPTNSRDQHSFSLPDWGCCVNRDRNRHTMVPTSTNPRSEPATDWKLGLDQTSVPVAPDQQEGRRNSFSGKAIPDAQRSFKSLRRLSELKIQSHENKDPNGRLTFSPKGLLKSKEGFVHFNEESLARSLRQNQTSASDHHDLW
eukprot:753649-Hanusia_phi.AAC.2